MITLTQGDLLKQDEVDAIDNAVNLACRRWMTCS